MGYIHSLFYRKCFMWRNTGNVVIMKNKEMEVTFVGAYFNPGNIAFSDIAHAKIYVDKTGLIAELNNKINEPDRCVVVSHPRRFGKTQAAVMLDAYYSCGCDSRKLFSDFDVAHTDDFEKHLNEYNVIHLDIASISGTVNENVVDEIKGIIVDEFREVYPELDYGKSLQRIMLDVLKRSGRRFVIIIDEWDCIIRRYPDKTEALHRYMQLLHILFKSTESMQFLALGYMTGILPIKKIEDESALNNFWEYTMLDSGKLTQYYGFTENEVEVLCKEYNMSYDAVKNWYNGYLINGIHMYNPDSVYRAMINSEVASYWKDTSYFKTINKYITLNFYGLRGSIIQILSGEHVDVNTRTFNNDLDQINTKDEALTALIHLGYLAYDEKSSTAYLPNYEVRDAYNAALSTGPWKKIAESVEQCEKLLRYTIDGDEENVARLIELAHEAYTSILTYNNELSLSCVITMAYFTASAYYNVIRELPSGKGFADIAFVPKPGTDKPPMLIELKYDMTADTAINQIKEKRYDSNLKGYNNVILVGVNYDKDGENQKKHTCVIERWNN